MQQIRMKLLLLLQLIKILNNSLGSGFYVLAAIIPLISLHIISNPRPWCQNISLSLHVTIVLPKSPIPFNVASFCCVCGGRHFSWYVDLFGVAIFLSIVCSCCDVKDLMTTFIGKSVTCIINVSVVSA